MVFFFVGFLVDAAAVLVLVGAFRRRFFRRRYFRLVTVPSAFVMDAVVRLRLFFVVVVLVDLLLALQRAARRLLISVRKTTQLKTATNGK